MKCTVIFQPSGRRGIVDTEMTLLAAAREFGADIESPCGGAGICGKCKVRVEEGSFQRLGIESKTDHLSPATEEEIEKLGEKEISKNYRLACCAAIKGDVMVYVPEESRAGKQIILETGREREFFIDPVVKNYYLEMCPATLKDQRDDFRRIKDMLEQKYGFQRDIILDYPVVKDLSGIIRRSGWKVTVSIWNEKEIIKVSPGFAENIWGVAIDVGSTTLAAYLCNLRTGETVAKKSMMNPQIVYGEDILSRITYSIMNEEGLAKLHRAIVEAINSLLEALAGEAGLVTAEIVDLVLVGNTVMHHIMLSIDPQYVGRSPFAPAFKGGMNFKARDLGLKINSGSYVHWLPLEAGFVGADNVAVLIAEEPYRQDEKMLIVDIGTNGEIVFGDREKLFSTSCATGPALEGAQIKYGMRAAFGAIEKVIIDPETKDPRIKIIGREGWFKKGDEPLAKGICGSAIIDVCAELFKTGIIDSTGRFNQQSASPRVRRDADGKMEYVLCYAEDTSIGKDIVITQEDIRAIQLAKAALYCGAEYLLEKFGATSPDRIVFAGAFGSYINKESAMVIGMVPDCSLKKVQAVGNAAGDGAKLALLSMKKRREAEGVAQKVGFVEMASEPDFQIRFAEALAFPHKKHKFPSVDYLLDRAGEKDGD
ncbi:MAG: DUF4445 domain-containing protein [Firmicutes bacterium]|nr:DUF4445 domain-containing protein [Bacillota bacterium]